MASGYIRGMVFKPQSLILLSGALQALGLLLRA